MKVVINTDTCIACSVCVSMCPEVFEISGDTVITKVDEIPSDLEESVRDAANSCPTDAISIEE